MVFNQSLTTQTPGHEGKTEESGDKEKFRCQSAATVLQKQPNALLTFTSVQTQTTSGWFSEIHDFPLVLTRARLPASSGLVIL
jgi:hypothetical protein